MGAENVAGKLTGQEQVLMNLLRDFANGFFNLPVQHPADAPEVVPAIHLLQEKLMIRPFVRANPEYFKGPE